MLFLLFYSTKMYWNYLFYLIWVIYALSGSVFLFSKGFLTVKDFQKSNSTCVPFNGTNHKLQELINNVDTAEKNCLPARAKVIILVVDALRYDFTLYDSSIKKPLPFQNRMPVINETLMRYPNNSRLYKFIADPPTTTMQRVKALTTGGLPTFIEAGSNFASNEINEDNLIDQLNRHNKTVVFMGDDTWEGLYPNRFLRSYPYPSFNVADLDTVDRGVESRIYEEIGKEDWDLLIGHMLGVDHCGHRYGPNHNEMSRKLTETNKVIRDIMNVMRNDMILFVLGDHGMTRMGDHGGQTDLEIEAALFTYSKVPLLNFSSNPKTIKQVNLVPTIATILGVPIPYPNLGSLIYDSMPALSLHPEWKYTLHAIWSNVQQVFEYFSTYSNASGAFESNKSTLNCRYESLRTGIPTIRDAKAFGKFFEQAVKLIEDVRSTCQKKWTELDDHAMNQGLILCIMSIAAIYIVSDGIQGPHFTELFETAFLKVAYFTMILGAVITYYCYYKQWVENFTTSVLLVTLLISLFVFAGLIIQNWDTVCTTWHTRKSQDVMDRVLFLALIAINSYSFLGNSALIEEATHLGFSLIICVVFLIVRLWNNTIRVKLTTFYNKSRFVLYLTIIAVLLRISVCYWKCRDEQTWCHTFVSTVKVSSVSKTFLAIGSLGTLVFIVKRWLREWGNLSGYAGSIVFASFLPNLALMCISAYWLMKQFPQIDDKAINYVWHSYALCIIGVLSVVMKPLHLHIKYEFAGVPGIFKKFVEIMRKNTMRSLYEFRGTATVYSSALLMIGMYLVLLTALILGDSNAPSAVIAFFFNVFLGILISLKRLDRAKTIADLFHFTYLDVMILVTSSHYFFYATHHQPTFSSIDWNAGLIGTESFLQYKFIPGTLIVFNTFSSYILIGMMLPMFFVAPFTLITTMKSMTRKKKQLLSPKEDLDELTLVEWFPETVPAVYALCCKYMLGHAIRVFVSMMGVTVHSKHLMLWTVFAPKFIFECLSMFVTFGSVLIGCFIFFRINEETFVFSHFYTIKKDS